MNIKSNALYDVIQANNALHAAGVETIVATDLRRGTRIELDSEIWTVTFAKTAKSYTRATGQLTATTIEARRESDGKGCSTVVRGCMKFKIA